MSYSQYGEEEHILQICSGIENGRLLDIGAWDARTFSNSRALIEKGWSAVLVEPSPGPLRNLIKEYALYPRVQVIGAAVTVGNHGSLIPLEVTDDAVTLPSTDTTRLEEWRATGGFYGKMWSCALSLAGLFAQLGGDFEMVSIDTEGTSLDVFAEMCRLGPRPRCVVLEHDSRHVELSQHAEKANYRIVHMNGTNTVLEWTGRRE